MDLFITPPVTFISVTVTFFAAATATCLLLLVAGLVRSTSARERAWKNVRQEQDSNVVKLDDMRKRKEVTME